MKSFLHVLNEAIELSCFTVSDSLHAVAAAPYSRPENCPFLSAPFVRRYCACLPDCPKFLHPFKYFLVAVFIIADFFVSMRFAKVRFDKVRRLVAEQFGAGAESFGFNTVPPILWHTVSFSVLPFPGNKLSRSASRCFSLLFAFFPFPSRPLFF